MPRFNIALLSLSLFAASGLHATMQVPYHLMTKPKPAEICPTSSASYPPSYTTFSATDTEAYLWFFVMGANAGDVFSSEYYTPSGQFYPGPSGAFDPLDHAGDWCFLDPAFKIAGNPPALQPGGWTVKVKYNGAQIFIVTFTITAATGGGTGSGAYSVNLIQNPNAEASTATAECTPGTPVPNWTPTGQFTVCSYGSSGSPTATDPGPPSRGNNFFFGGYTGESTGTQSLDVSWAAADIDRGGVSYTLSGYVGGFDGQDDSVTVKALFRASPFGAAQQAKIGPVLSAERNGATGLLLKSTTGTVPVGTRQIDIVQDMIRSSGNANDGYADNLSFVLTPGAATCSFTVQPLAQSIAAAGSVASVQVTAGSSCAWTAISNASWITIQSGASGTGNGSVSYRADVNTATIARTGTLTIAGATVTVTQAAATPACSYSITPTSNTLPSSGGSGTVRVTTADGCGWTARANDSWIALTSAATGTGSGSVTYGAGANTSAVLRSGTITIAGASFSLTQPGGSSSSAPGISQGGIVNAASNRSTSIGRGSFFTIYGTNLGPAIAQQAGYPIPDTMGGVVVNVVKGSIAKRAYLQYVSATQINAILPSDTPLGAVQLSVSFQGSTGAPATVTVADSAFGIFSTAGGSGPGIIQNWMSAGSAPLNTQMNPAKPGQTIILWGTGLGPIPTADNQPPPGGDMPVPVEVRVGGKLAPKLYSGRAPGFAGVDNIYFQVPADAPMGCSVPVQIKAGANWSNEVRMAISSNGARCSDPGNPFSDLTVNGGKIGVVALLRVGLNGQLESSQPPVNLTIDLGLGVFSEIKAGGEMGFSPILSLPPLGSCVSTVQAFDIGSLLGGGGGLIGSTGSRQMDAGAALTVVGPKGTKLLPRSTTAPGPYLGLLGGSLPLPDAPPMDPFLDGGSFTISGPGGADVGAFTTTLAWPPPITWTNQSQIGVINRANGVTINWTGGDASQVVLIAGGSTDQKTKNSGGFFCLTSAVARTFTVPASTLADLPPTGATTGLSDSIALVAIASLPMSNLQKFTARGLDSGFVLPGTLLAKTVQIQ